MLSNIETLSKVRGIGTCLKKRIREREEAPRQAANTGFHLWNISRKIRRFSTVANSDKHSTTIQLDKARYGRFCYAKRTTMIKRSRTQKMS